ncbi:hypothetical protein AGMMS49965_03600 [Bacteroidia bacterium]|nr:hypothetical protein AGMMS49965_03600 [Bacteroidia bacterium]
MRQGHVYTTYFAQPMRGEATEDNVYARLHENGISTELTNNYYTSDFSRHSSTF